MEVKEAITRRRSQRSFLSKPIEKAVIEELIEAANLAPSASNSQNRHFVIVTDETTKQALHRICVGQKHILEAPAVIAVTVDVEEMKPHKFLAKSVEWEMDIWGARETDYEGNEKFTHNWKIWNTLWPIEDAAAAIMTLMYAAVDKGLATCWVGLFDEDEAAEALGLPDNYRVIALVPIGYPKDPSGMQARRSHQELVHWEKW